MFCEDFGEVDKKTISKIAEDFKKKHNRVVANVSNTIIIGPESDHWECLSVTDALTHSLTD